MDKNNMDRIKKVIDKESKGEAFVFLSEAGTYINGNAADLVTLQTLLIRTLHKNGVPKDILDTSYALAFKEGEELLDEIMTRLETAIQEAKSGLKGEKE